MIKISQISKRVPESKIMKTTQPHGPQKKTIASPLSLRIHIEKIEPNALEVASINKKNRLFAGQTSYDLFLTYLPISHNYQKSLWLSFLILR
jgi:hypothetical protein